MIKKIPIVWSLLVVLLLAMLQGCASGAPLEGDTAPDFDLAGADGRRGVLSQLVQRHEAVVLVFYRGFF